MRRASFGTRVQKTEGTNVAVDADQLVLFVAETKEQ